MSLQSRREYLLRIKDRYLKSTPLHKSKILNESCETTGMNRKYLISCLSAGCDLRFKNKKQRKRRKSAYDRTFTGYLKKIWELLDYPCGERLKPMLPPMVLKLRQFHEMDIPEAIEKKLRTVSHSTIDEKLKPWKRAIRRRFQGTTKPGSLLKKQIPIRTSSWEETRPGFCEMDTVAHCGGSLDGLFAFTVNITDILTGWGEQETILGKSEKAVVKAFKRMRSRSPVGIAGIDPDNGSEFINWNMYRYCEAEKIAFTRGRPYKKNDNAHIEQKNWTHVRKVYGYERIENPEIIALMNDLNRNELRLYKNFFQPTIKLTDKRRTGAHGEKIKRIYDEPKTPYERVLRCPDISEEKKRELMDIYASLNPVALRKTLLQKLKEISRRIAARKRKS